MIGNISINSVVTLSILKIDREAESFNVLLLLLPLLDIINVKYCILKHIIVHPYGRISSYMKV